MHALRLQCNDKPGIVAAVAATLSNNQCNIEESSQFFDHFSGQFFMRVVFTGLQEKSLSGFIRDFEDNAARFSMEWQVCDLTRPVRTLVLVSKADHCLHDLLYRTKAGLLPIEITAVASNHPDLGPLVQNAGHTYHLLPAGKENQEKIIDNLIQETDAELILLARYMQVLSDEMCSKYAGRIINIHHSFLPGFKGARPYHQAYARGVKMIGATAHYATADLDEGPIISQGVESVDHAHTPEKMQQMGRDIEARVLARAARLFAERRIFLQGQRTIIL